MTRIRAEAVRPTLSRSQDNLDSDSLSDSLETVTWPTCDIFNTTFSLYRASPLFVGRDGLSEKHLRTLEARLRDMLTGDAVRGIEVGLDEDGDGTMRRAGALEAVTLEWASVHEYMATSRPALRATIQYENAYCLAILLPAQEAPKVNDRLPADSGDAFLSLPLILFRMPAPLKDTIAIFLSNAFDCRITPMHLTRQDMIHSFESWARATALPTAGPLAKDVVLTLEFNLPELQDGAGVAGNDAQDYTADLASLKTSDIVTTADSGAIGSTNIGLKTVDVFIPNIDLGGFLKTGKKLELDRDDMSDKPFTTALSYYLKHHLGLDPFDSAIGIVRVACGGFVLSTNRLKVLLPPGSASSAALDRHRGSVPQIFKALVSRAIG